MLNISDMGCLGSTLGGVTVGLTGGIGCGKSACLRLFGECGARTVETDAVVRELLETDRELIGDIRKTFGDGVLDGAGRIDRGQLGSLVFGDSDALKRLEALVHPRVRAHWKREMAQKHPLLVVEIPLLFEKELEGYFEWTVCVCSVAAIRRERLRARGMTEADIKRREERQYPLVEKMARADSLVHNNGSLCYLREQVRCWVAAVRAGAKPFRVERS